MKRLAFAGSLVVAVVIAALVFGQTGTAVAPQDTVTTTISYSSEGATAFLWDWKGRECVGVTQYVVSPGVDSRGALDGSPPVLRKYRMSVVVDPTKK
jgi:hypothetical protein